MSILTWVVTKIKWLYQVLKTDVRIRTLIIPSCNYLLAFFLIGDVFYAFLTGFIVNLVISIVVEVSITYSKTKYYYEEPMHFLEISDLLFNLTYMLPHRWRSDDPLVYRNSVNHVLYCIDCVEERLNTYQDFCIKEFNKKDGQLNGIILFERLAEARVRGLTTPVTVWDGCHYNYFRSYFEGLRSDIRWYMYCIELSNNESSGSEVTDYIELPEINTIEVKRSVPTPDTYTGSTTA